MQVLELGGKTLYVSDVPPEDRKKKSELFDKYPDLMTPEHIAELTGQCKTTIRSLCSSQALPAVRIGRRWYVPKPAMIEYVTKGGNDVR